MCKSGTAFVPPLSTPFSRPQSQYGLKRRIKTQACASNFDDFAVKVGDKTLKEFLENTRRGMTSGSAEPIEEFFRRTFDKKQVTGVKLSPVLRKIITTGIEEGKSDAEILEDIKNTEGDISVSLQVENARDEELEELRRKEEYLLKAISNVKDLTEQRLSILNQQKVDDDDDALSNDLILRSQFVGKAIENLKQIFQGQIDNLESQDLDAIVPRALYPIYDDEGVIVGDGEYEDTLSPLRSTTLEPLSPEETVAELDPVKFAGKWAQVYGAAGDKNSGQFFCITTDYKLRPDGTSVDVTNYGGRFIGDTNPSIIRGTASLVSPERPGIFKLVLNVIDLGFFTVPVKGDYWVVGLGNPDDLDGEMYPWAVVTNPKRNRLFVIARDRESFDEKYGAEVKRVVNRLNLAKYYQKIRC